MVRYIRDTIIGTLGAFVAAGITIGGTIALNRCYESINSRLEDTGLSQEFYAPREDTGDSSRWEGIADRIESRVEEPYDFDCIPYFKPHQKCPL